MKHFSCFIVTAFMFLTGCSSHFISDNAFRGEVSEDFASRSEILAASGVDLDAMNINQQEKEALEFLYAYMPLGDIVNREPSYYLEGHFRSLNRLSVIVHNCYLY